MRDSAPDRFPSRRLLLVTAVVGLALVVGPAGCGGGGPLGDDAPAAKTVDGRNVTALGHLTSGGQIAAGAGFVAVVTGHGAAGELRVAEGRRVPVRAPGSGRVPAWAQPHVGTDAAGKAVITYPRCSGPTLVSCDLYGWRPDTKEESKLAGTVRGATRDERRMKATHDGQSSAELDRIQTGETEGVMDRGRILFLREWPRESQRSVGRTPPISYQGANLWIRLTDGRVRALDFRSGRMLALGGDYALSVSERIPATDRTPGRCGSTVLDLWPLKAGLPTLSRVSAAEVDCDASGLGPTAPVIHDGYVFYGVASGLREGMAYRYEIASGKTAKVSVGQRMQAWAPIDAKSGYVLSQAEPVPGGALAGSTPALSTPRPACRPDPNPAGQGPAPCELAAISGLDAKQQPQRTRTPSGVTETTVHRYPGRVAVASRGKALAVAVAQDDSTNSLQLRFSVDGSDPQPAEGAGRVAFWSRPHVGTDDAGRLVVTYPRCTTVQGERTVIRDCDLYAWNAVTKQESLLKGVSGPLGETEAVMDRGNILFVRESVAGSRTTEDDYRLSGRPGGSALLYKPVGEPIRTVRKDGGRLIDLAGDHVVDVAQGGADDALCGSSNVRLMDLSGAIDYTRNIGCGLDGGGVIGPSVQDGHLRFAREVNEGNSELFSLPFGSEVLDHKTLSGPIFDWASISASSGYALRDDNLGSSCGGLFEGEPPVATCDLLLLTGAALRHQQR